MPPGAPKAPPKGGPGVAGTDAPAPSRVTMSDLKSDAPDTYTVQKGDTLWGIAGRFLKEPWRWPEIWQMNKDQIKNPHLIYPGDIIRLDRSGEFPGLTLAQGGTGAAAAASNVVRLDPRIRVEPLATAIPTIPGAVIGPFLSRPLIIEANGLDNAPTILAAEDGRVIVGAGDQAYADRIAAAGNVINWQVFRPGRPLRDPDNNEILGYEARYVADARVRRFGNPTTLEITKGREEVSRGDRLVPALETTLPSYVPRAPEKQIEGSIMSVDGGVSELGQYQVVAINRGARDGIAVGHVLASYRRGLTLTASGETPKRWFEPPAWMGEMTVTPVPVVPDPPRPPPPPTEGPVHVEGPITLPDERNGLIFVFRVFERLSYALVMRASRPIAVGDRVRTP